MFNFVLRGIRNNNFLPINYGVNPQWCVTDTEEVYNQNLKRKSKNWYYRTHPVTYTTNKNGYRTQEFNKIDWANSVVVFGCSQVYGVGLDDSDTMPAQLSRIIGIPVINMGVPGSSNNFILHNSSILASKYPTPKAVIHMWTGYDRTVVYHKNDISHYGSWNIKEGNFADLWTENKHNAIAHSIFASKIANQMWNNRSIFFEASSFPSTARAMGCSYINKLFNDQARDLLHAGRLTNAHIAEKIAEHLCK